MHPSKLKINDFTYQLPDERIARYPLNERDNSKLLIYRNGKISEDTYQHLGEYLPENSLLVFNDTRVIHARLMFHTIKNDKVEVFCLEPVSSVPDMALAMSQTKSARWKCMIGRASKWKEKILLMHAGADPRVRPNTAGIRPNERVRPPIEFKLEAELVDRLADAFIVEFRWQPEHLTFAEILNEAGGVPIPPYLKREPEDIDNTRYQTVYAKQEGSVAAPTAGLHFTEEIFNSLKKKNIQLEYATLHVGAGTFKPVKSETMQGHAMHEEWMEVSFKTIEHLLNSLPHTIVAVGTTSLRTIETIYWMGIKALLQPASKIHELEITQWEVYEIKNEIEPAKALQALLGWMKRNELETLFCKTQILIAPGYTLRIADALITNFHQPGSTLLLLVAGIVGNDWRKIYDYALAHNFRFLSYGDGSLLFA